MFRALKSFLYKISLIRFLYFKYIRSFKKQRDINIYILRRYKFNYALDVGANKGLYSRELEKISKKVFIFEPIKKLYNELCKILDKKTIKFNYALGNSFENKKINIPILKNSISYGRASISQKFKKYESELIKVRSLDYLIKKKKLILMTNVLILLKLMLRDMNTK